MKNKCVKEGIKDEGMNKSMTSWINQRDKSVNEMREWMNEWARVNEKLKDQMTESIGVLVDRSLRHLHLWTLLRAVSPPPSQSPPPLPADPRPIFACPSSHPGPAPDPRAPSCWSDLHCSQSLSFLSPGSSLLPLLPLPPVNLLLVLVSTLWKSWTYDEWL